MKWTDFFTDDKTGKGSSARLVFIIAALVGVVCTSFAYIWVIIHGATFDSSTTAYWLGILVLAGKVSFDKYISYKQNSGKKC